MLDITKGIQSVTTFRRNPAQFMKQLKRSLRQLLYGKKPHVYRAIFEIDTRAGIVHVLPIRHCAMDVALPETLT